MRRALHTLFLTGSLLALSAPLALAAEGHDGGEGSYGETTDKVVTERRLHHHRRVPGADRRAELIMWALDKRKDAAQEGRQGAHARAPTCAAAGSPGRLPSAPAPPRVVTIDRPERRNAIDGPTAEALHEAFRAFVADDGARVLVVTGGGEEAFCAGADLKALDTLGPRLDLPEGPLGFTRLALAEADDRRGLGLVPGRRLRARAVVRPARRDPERALRLHRAPLRRAADRRRDAAAAADRRQRPRARPRRSPAA